MKPPFSHDNLYEVNIRQYTPEGTFNAFSRELSRLKSMGISTLWLMPITPIAEKGKKGSLGSPYSAQHYTQTNSEFGSIEDFKNLVEKIHSLGMKIIIDWVANHTGWDHIWTSSHPKFYKKTEDDNFLTASGMDDIIELDYDKPELWHAMIDAMNFWVKECDIDGFRCDLASWVRLEFWKEAKKKLEQNKPLFWLGEYDELDHPEYAAVFHASYSWQWMHKSEDFCKHHISLTDLKQLLIRYSEIGDHSMRTWFTSNHDENSWNGTEYDKYGSFAQAFAVFSSTWNGLPLLYSGQELPNRKKLKFFDKDTIEWRNTNELESFYKTLLHLKSTHPALAGGDASVTTYFIHTNYEEKIFAYLRRKSNTEEVLILLNFSNEILNIELYDQEILGTFQDVFSSEIFDFSIQRKLNIKDSGYLVLKKI